MMFLLTIDVTGCDLDSGDCEAETAVSSLPGELGFGQPREGFPQPLGGVSLEELDRLGCGLWCGNLKQRVDVVRHSAYCDSLDSVRPSDAAEIGPEALPDLWRQPTFPSMGCPNTMHQTTVIRMHDSPSVVPLGLAG